MTSQTTPMIDPVCGMTVDASAPETETADGQTYRFCSAGCHSTFLKNPNHYTTAANTPAEPQTK